MSTTKITSPTPITPNTRTKPLRSTLAFPLELWNDVDFYGIGSIWGSKVKLRHIPRLISVEVNSDHSKLLAETSDGFCYWAYLPSTTTRVRIKEKHYPSFTVVQIVDADTGVVLEEDHFDSTKGQFDLMRGWWLCRAEENGWEVIP